MASETELRVERVGRALIDQRGAGAGDLWARAWQVVLTAHAGQMREDGHPYTDHVLVVAEILCFEWHLEPLVVAGGLLHDVIRHGPIKSPQALGGLLGHGALTEVVAATTRLANTVPLVHQARDNTSLQRIFEFMVEDVRAVLIQIANRLANLRHGARFSQERQRLMILNSQEVYLPLLERLGMWQVRAEVEDWCLRLRDPEHFAAIQAWRDAQARQRRSSLVTLRREMSAELARLGVTATVETVFRPVGAIHRRLNTGSARAADRLDTLDPRYLYTVFVTVEAPADAYTALAAVHRVGTPSTPDFRDYLAQPKANGYAALHTTIIRQAEGSEAARVMIRTHHLRALAEHGILTPEAFAHWCGERVEAATPDWERHERTVLRQFVDSLRRRAPDPGTIVVFTPQRDLIESLPVDATVLDFAYHIHTDLGRQAGRAFVNGRPVPLHERLHNGDVVQIEKDLSREWPDPEWLEWVVTPKARSKLQAQLNRRPDHKGRRLIEKALRARGRLLRAYESRIAALAHELGSTTNELYAAVAKGDFTVHEIVDRLIFHRSQRRTLPHIEPAPEVAHRFPAWAAETLLPVPCCSPAANSPIVGVLVASGVELHTADCPNVPDDDRLIPLVWRAERVEWLQPQLRVRAVNRVGLLHELTGAISRGNIDITSIRGERRGAMAEFTFVLEVPNSLELGYLTNTIRAVNGVVRVEVDGQEASDVVNRLTAFLAPPQPLPNPFSPGRPVSGAGRFWGRSEELESFETRLLSRHPASSLLVRGPRRIGKTSFLKQLGESKAIRAQYRPVYADLQSVAFSSAEEIIRYLCRCIGRALDPTDRIPRPSQREIVADPHNAFLTYVEAVADQLRHALKRVLVTIDEFGVLVEALHAGQLDPNFFALLRSIMQHNEILVFVVATSDDMAEILRAEGVTELLNVTQEVRLGHLDAESARHLVQDPLRGQVYFDPGAVDELLSVTGRHPYFLQILAAALVSHLNGERRRQVLDSDIATVVQRHAQSNGSEFAHLWQRDDPVERLVLATLAAGAEHPTGAARSRRSAEGLTAAEINRRLDGYGRALPSAQLLETLNRLHRAETLGRTAREGELRYDYQVPLFRNWFAEHYPLPHVVQQRTEGSRS